MVHENKPLPKSLLTDPAAVRSAQFFYWATPNKKDSPVSVPTPDFQEIGIEMNLQPNFCEKSKGKVEENKEHFSP